MNTEFGEKLQNAIDNRNKIQEYSWKSKEGNTILLMDASKEQLTKWFKHCTEMLYNLSPWSPGKLKVRENITNLWHSCNTELFVRYLLHEVNTSIKSKKDILDLINDYRSHSETSILNESISSIFSGLDPIYEKITISKLMDACFDKLEILNKKMISDKFILSQGIWLTDDEKSELTEVLPNGQIRNRMEVIKERLGINPEVKLRVSPTGLSFAQFRSLVNLAPMSKISELPTTTLKTLRDKVLLLLDNDLDYHINKWTTLLNNIIEVAKERNITLA